MDKNKYFADDIRELLVIAQDVALDLGDESIDTVHFILADCLLNRDYSLQELLFSTEEDLNSYYDSKRKSESRILVDTPSGMLPLTDDASLTIRYSLNEKKKYRHDLVHRYHLFMAMSLIDQTSFRMNESSEDLYVRLVEYYKSKGCKFETPKKATFISVLKLIFRPRR